MYGSRAMMGRGLLDSFETRKRPQMQSNSFIGSNVGASRDYGFGPKRSRMTDSLNPYLMGGAVNYYQTYGGSYSGGIDSVNSFPVVRLRGLPFDCEDLDVYEFFAGLNIVDCLMVNKDGRFSGDAFVVFSSPVQADLAVQKDRQNMGHRYIEVFHCSKQDYYRAVASEANSAGISDNGNNQRAPSRAKKQQEDKDQMEYTEFLKLRGLPYSVTKSEIVDFFGSFEPQVENVRIAHRSDGKATGEAYVEFASAEVAKNAMCMDKMAIGSRYVELFPSTRDEARKAGP